MPSVVRECISKRFEPHHILNEREKRKQITPAVAGALFLPCMRILIFVETKRFRGDGNLWPFAWNINERNCSSGAGVCWSAGTLKRNLRTGVQVYDD